MQNSLATLMKPTDAPAGTGQRTDMLSQYAKAIDEAMVSFHQAFQRHPGDGQLVTALAQFRRGLEGQLSRLEAMRHRFTDEKELQALDRTIRSVKRATQLAASSRLTSSMC